MTTPTTAVPASVHRVQVTLVLRPAPPLPSVLSGRLAQLVETWSRLVTPIPAGGDGDYEDWVEMACRLQGVLDAYGPQHVLVCDPGNWVRPPRYLDGATGAEMPAPDTDLPDVGVILGRHDVERTKSGACASDYMVLRAFAANAGRRLELAGIMTGDDHDAEAAVQRMRAAGVGRIYAKARSTKTLNKVLEPDQSLVDVLDEGEEWTLIRKAGTPEGILVQEWVPMRFEYRIFVVDHQVVTGAGSLVERTPLDNTGHAFDPAVRERRADSAPLFGGVPVERPDVVAKLVQFARRVVAELAVEVPHMSEYVIDVALGPDDQPLVIELNGYENAGLFACRTDLLYAALAARARPTQRVRLRAVPVTTL